MNIYLPCDSRMTIGGGFTFKSNFQYAVEKIPDMQIVDSIDVSDIILLLGSSVVTEKTLSNLHHSGKKIVLRVDGYPEDWRNGGSGISRLAKAYQYADAVIYQSLFSLEFVGGYLEERYGKKERAIIYNGVDTDIFSYEGDRIERDAKRVIVTNFYRKDPNKRYEEVLYRYRDLWIQDKNVSLWVVGRIPTMYAEYGGGFFNGERVQFFGVIQDPYQLAEILRSGDEFWYPSFADPCPNALLEAMFSGLTPKYVSDFGGAQELEQLYFDLDTRNRKELTLKTMIYRYYQFLSSLL